MRVVLTPELQKMADAVEPYIVVDGLNVYLSPEAPSDIVEMDKKVMDFYQKSQDTYEKEALGLT